MTAIAMSPADEALDRIDYKEIPSVLILADEPAGEQWRWAVRSAGCGVIDVVPIAAAAARLDRQVAADAVLLDCGEDPAGGLDGLLDRLEEGGERGRFRSVVATPLGLVDRVAARAWTAEIEQLCEPSQSERVAAVRVAATARPLRLHDVNKAQATARLQQLSEEVGRIANVLAA